MEHFCPRCAYAVDDNLPFCPNCEAPQVRFSPRDAPPLPVVVPSVGKSLTPVHPQAEPIFDEAPPAITRNWRRVLRPALSAGAIAALVSVIPLISLVALPVGGILSVVFFRQSSARMPSPKFGFGLGALSGLCCLVILVAIKTVSVFLSHSKNEIWSDVVQQVHLAQARNSDPQLQPVWEFLLSPQGLIVVLAASLIIMGSVLVLLSGVGGAVSAAILRRKDLEGRR